MVDRLEPYRCMLCDPPKLVLLLMRQQHDEQYHVDILTMSEGNTNAQAQ